MSRSNPYVIKRRQAKDAVLLFGEGSNEEIFLKHLRGLYAYESNVAVTVKGGNGGDPKNIIIDACKIPGDYGRRVVVLDNDKASSEMDLARAEAKKRGVELIENTPCLEYLFLLLLDEQPINKTSKWCKSKFESKYISDKKRRELNEYKKTFPKGLLDAKTQAVVELNRLISVMGGD